MLSYIDAEDEIKLNAFDLLRIFLEISIINIDMYRFILRVFILICVCALSKVKWDSIK